MRLQTVIDLKQELRGLRGHAIGGFTKVAGSSVPTPASVGAAVGVAPGQGVQDYRIAIRTTQQTPQVAQWIHTLNLVTSGELDVVHVGQILASPPSPPGHQPYMGRARPLAPGYSVGHVSTSAGTIGAFVEVSGLPHILSNNHVLALSNAAQFNDIIVQPGPIDGGTHPMDSVSRLSKFVPLQPGVNYVDAAVGVVDINQPIDLRYAGQPLGFPVQAHVGLGAWKLGRTTGATEGVVTAIELDDVPVQYGNTVLMFDGQVEIAGTNGLFSAGGDSGSLITDLARNPFALLFAGSADLNRTYGNPIELVLQHFGATLLR